MARGLTTEGTLIHARTLCKSAQATQAAENTRVYWTGVLNRTLRNVQSALDRVKRFVR